MFYFKKKFYENYAVVLDFVPPGYYSLNSRFRRKGVAQVIGEDYFILLEILTQETTTLSIRERIYIGKGVSDRFFKVSRRLSYDDLTMNAKTELPYIVSEIISRKEKKFVEFFNNARPLTTRMHSLELLRGIGKKTLWEILEERKKKPFKSFKDIEERTRIPSVKKIIVERIIEEIMGKQKYYIFVAPLKYQY
mgnify:CR=1 FL=1